MMIYWALVRFHFWRFLTYPMELVGMLARHAIDIVFLALFWSLVISQTSQADSLRGILSYFLVARGVSDLVMAEKASFGKLLRRFIKYGEISFWMLKPVPLIPSLYASTFGRNGLNTVIAIVSIGIGLALEPPASFVSVIFFLYFFVCAWMITFAFNLFEGVLAFFFTEAQGMKNALSHVTKILSGAMVPLAYFPESIRAVVEYLPFPHMVFGPTHAFTYSQVTEEILQSGIVALAWGVGLILAISVLWRMGVRRYEAIGI